MKTVFSNSELAHIWIHGKQDYGRNGNGSFYFDDNTIYSYGSHFPIATKLTNKRGEICILYTTESYRITTAKHKNEVWRAIPKNEKYKVFNIPLINNVNHLFVCDYYRDQIKKTYNEAMQGKKGLRYDRLQRMLKYQETGLEYSKFFSLKEKFPLELNKEDLEDQLKVSLVDKQAHDLKNQEKDRKRSEARELSRKEWELEQYKNIEEKVITWRSGGYASLPSDYPVMLRIKANDIQSSKGAIFPVSQANPAIMFIKSVMNSGIEWNSNTANHEIKLGIYKVDKIEVNGTVTAGCHIVQYDEIARLELELHALTA